MTSTSDPTPEPSGSENDDQLPTTDPADARPGEDEGGVADEGAPTDPEQPSG